MLTKQELATKLKKTPRGIELWMRHHYLPYIKVGRSVYFRWKDAVIDNNGADGGGRTHTVSLPLDFESSASANSATSATLITNHLRLNRLTQFGSATLLSCETQRFAEQVRFKAAVCLHQGHGQSQARNSRPLAAQRRLLRPRHGRKRRGAQAYFLGSTGGGHGGRSTGGTPQAIACRLWPPILHGSNFSGDFGNDRITFDAARY